MVLLIWLNSIVLYSDACDAQYTLHFSCADRVGCALNEMAIVFLYLFKFTFL